MRGLAGLVVAVLCLNGDRLHGQSGDWSGTWTSKGLPVRVLRNVHLTARGWDQTAENLIGAQNYTITIRSAADRMLLTFPGGANNMLTTDVAIDGLPHTSVDDKGDWWVKRVTTAREQGPSLDVTSTTSSGWKSTRPEKTEPAATDFKKHLVLEIDSATGELLLHVTLGDEKGELEYVQRFRRVP